MWKEAQWARKSPVNLNVKSRLISSSHVSHSRQSVKKPGGSWKCSLFFWYHLIWSYSPYFTILIRLKCWTTDVQVEVFCNKFYYFPCSVVEDIIKKPSCTRLVNPFKCLITLINKCSCYLLCTSPWTVGCRYSAWFLISGILLLFDSPFYFINVSFWVWGSELHWIFKMRIDNEFIKLLNHVFVSVVEVVVNESWYSVGCFVAFLSYFF